MKITLVKPNATLHYESVEADVPTLYYKSDTIEIDLDLLPFRLNAVLSREQRAMVMPEIEQFFAEQLGVMR